jgi:hypothetical protein
MLSRFCRQVEVDEFPTKFPKKGDEIVMKMSKLEEGRRGRPRCVQRRNLVAKAVLCVVSQPVCQIVTILMRP